jgi:hypothetical protein
MTDTNELPRLYGEKEVARLLKRATELQRQEPVEAAGSGGLSLAELEEIASEAGIDPRHLRRAASELEAGGTALERVVGERLSLENEAVVPGELPDDGFMRVVAAIQSASGELGQPSLVGRTLTWRAETAGKSRTIHITVGVHHGETHIRVQERLHQLASGLLIGSTAGAGVGVGLGVGIPAGTALGSVLFGIAFPVGMIGLTYLSARSIYRALVRRRRSVLTNLMERITAEVRSAIADRALPEGAPEPRER